MSTPQTNIKTLRESFSTFIELGEQGSNGISETMKLINVGETAELIAESLAELNMMNNQSTESGWKSKMRSLVPFGLLDKAEENVRKGVIKGSTIAQVTKNIIDSITTKRTHVESMVEGLFDLYDKINISYNNVRSIKQDIEQRLEDGDFEDREEFHAKILLAEILEYQSIQQENMNSAKGAIEAARVSVQQIAALQPKLKAQLNDGLSIRASIEELNTLTSTCSAIEVMCEGLRTENREKVATAQLEAIKRYTVSDSSLKAIQDSTKRQNQLMNNISKSREEMVNSSQRKIDELLVAVETSHKTQIENCKDEIDSIRGLTFTTKL